MSAPTQEDLVTVKLPRTYDVELLKRASPDSAQCA